jgi:hypothetical protein
MAKVPFKVITGDAESEGAWEAPDWSLLDDRRGELPEFPSETLPAKWRDWAELAAHGAGVTPAHVIIPLLGITSALIGAARRVTASRSWSEPMTMWLALVGFSGTGKTPGLDVTRRHVARIEKDGKEQTAEMQRQHSTRVEAAKAALKKWKHEVEEAIGAGLPPPPRSREAADIADFVVPRLYVSDVTIERLAVLLNARPRGMSVIIDELAGLFLNMGRYSNGSDREFWLEAWNGKHYTVERMGRPPLALENLLVGLVGGLQPDKLNRSFEGDSDGMYARVCFSWPSEPAYKPLTNEVAEIEPEVLNALKRIVSLEAGEDGEFAPRGIWLDDDALAAFEAFRKDLHTTKAFLDGREREWTAKGASHVLRLAGTLEIMAWAINSHGDPEPKHITAASMQSAITVWREYFLPHGRAALRQIGLSERHGNARRVLNWAKGKDCREISREDVRRDALGQHLDAAQTDALLDGLRKSGWLRPINSKTGKAGRPRALWDVNPALWDGRNEGAEG